MAASDNLNGGQFDPGSLQYRQVQYGSKMNPRRAVAAFDPATGEGVGTVTASGTNLRGWTVDVAHVRQDMKGQGVGKTLLNVMNYSIGPGAKVGIPDALSPEGFALATSYGGKDKVPVSKPTTGPWGARAESSLAEAARGRVNEHGERTFEYGTAYDAASRSGEDVPEARYLAHRPVQDAPPAEKYTQQAMFRKVKGQEVPVKKAMP
jgi:hypothetical protein